MGARADCPRLGRNADLDTHRLAAAKPAGNRRLPQCGHRLRRCRCRRPRRRRNRRVERVWPGRAEAFRDALDVDDGTWNRARGYALHQAASIIPYYAVTNPGFVTPAKRTVEEVLADLSSY